MTMTFGGLGLMLIRRPFAELSTNVLGKSDMCSMFCLVVFTIILFLLGASSKLHPTTSAHFVFYAAYLTNPSETSFRTYLTEQSFRHHLSRLDDSIDDDQDQHEKTRTVSSLYPRGHTLPINNHSPFHFANRASVSLRTPKHVFHTFGIFTVAAIIPLARVDRPNGDDVSVISDSWFIGAFGKWWRGGVLETWYQDVIARSGDSESWSSGILGMKSLDMCGEYCKNYLSYIHPPRP